jgi:hypothetical protein
MIRIQWEEDGSTVELPEYTRCTSTRCDLRRPPTARPTFFGSPGEEGAFVSLEIDLPEKLSPGVTYNRPFQIGNSRWVRLEDWKRLPRPPFGRLYIETGEKDDAGRPIWRLGRIWPKGRRRPPRSE